MTPENISTSIEALIRQRKTLKVLSPVDQPAQISADAENVFNPIVLDSIKSAGWAPFHYDRAVDGMAEPWRAHVLWHQDCRKVAANFNVWFDDVKPSNKLPPMLSACGALVLVTWLPQFSFGACAKSVESAADQGVPKEKQVVIDEEHLAATSAMVQNLLLLLTAHGMGTYWSSGGQFRTPTMFEKLGIGLEQRLLAAVFVEYPSTQSEERERLAGKHRDARSGDSKWVREVGLG
ncbi:MAG: hypothetical protein AB8B55_23790 [Mariniblastus sp.]